MHESVIRLEDPGIGLDGFLAIHSRKRGPAHGGFRIADYPDRAACRRDALRLSEAMTRKCALHGIPGGGGKIVLMRGPIRDRRAVIRAVGRRIHDFGGFYTGTDTGTTLEDMRILREVTPHVCCEDLSDAAAAGVLHAIRAACTFVGIPLKGLRAIVQGLGSVGFLVAVRLMGEGAVVAGADPDPEACGRAAARGVKIVEPSRAGSIECDLFSPCATGDVVTRENVDRLRCSMIVGAANCQLEDDSLADRLHERGIVYVPDFVANSGATVRGAWKNLRGTPGTDEEIARIRELTLAILQEARRSGTAPLRVAVARSDP